MKTIAVLVSFCLLSLSCVKERDYPVLGKTPVKSLSEHEVKAGALLNWAKAGLDDVTLVSINASSGLGRLETGALKEIKGLSAGGEWNELGTVLSGRGGLINADNYISAALALGLVKKVYWVLPYRLFADIVVAEGKIKDFLKSSGSGLTDAEIDWMKMDSGCLKGAVRGRELYVCGFSTLHLIAAPVVLDLGVDFFPAMAFEYGVNKLGAMKTLFDALSLRQLRVMRADVTYGIQEGCTRPIHRYIGEEAAEALRNPAALAAKTPPEMWAARDMAENMFSGGEGTLVLKYLEDPMKKFPRDPALPMLQAAALVRTGKGKAALDNTVKLCAARKDYCEGLVYLAYLAGARGDDKLKAAFLAKADELMPKGHLSPAALRYDAYASSDAVAVSAPRERY